MCVCVCVCVCVCDVNDASDDDDDDDRNDDDYDCSPETFRRSEPSGRERRGCVDVRRGMASEAGIGQHHRQ